MFKVENKISTIHLHRVVLAGSGIGKKRERQKDCILHAIVERRRFSSKMETL